MTEWRLEFLTLKAAQAPLSLHYCENTTLLEITCQAHMHCNGFHHGDSSALFCSAICISKCMIN